VFDGVMSLAVLEHVPDDRPVLDECARVLKPGGLCLHAVPFIQGFHAVPDDYRRYTLHGLREVLSPEFEEIESGVLLGPASALAWILREFFATLTAGRSVLLYNAGMLIYGWIFWPVKFLDIILMRSPFAPQIASGVYYLGRRRAGASTAQSRIARPA
jgi:SAM-dependent methyltransferase